MPENNKPKILYIHATMDGHGGATVITKNTMEMFTEHGYETAIFTRKNTYDKNYKYAKYFTDWKRSNSLINNLKFFYNWEAENNFKNFLNDFKPDIVHIHNIFHPYISYSVLKPCFDKKIPVIMTVHDAYLICPTTKLLIGNKNFCTKKLCKKYNKLPCIFNKCNNTYWQSSLLALSSFVNKITGYDRKISKYITPSDALKNLLIQNNKDIKPDKIITINNYLAESEFKDTKPNYDNNGYFLYVGRLVNEKGIQYLLKAIKDLPKEIEFHIVGDGPYEATLKKYAEENYIDNVKFLGFKNREEIKEEYKNCIATILPSTCFENFGLSNIESFINGKPVIGSNMGGIPEVVENNKEGLIFDSCNVEQLKECILKYWYNPDLVKEHGKNGYEKSIRKYTEEMYYKKLKNLYEEVLNEK